MANKGKRYEKALETALDEMQIAEDIAKKLNLSKGLKKKIKLARSKVYAAIMASMDMSEKDRGKF